MRIRRGLAELGAGGVLPSSLQSSEHLLLGHLARSHVVDRWLISLLLPRIVESVPSSFRVPSSILNYWWKSCLGPLSDNYLVGEPCSRPHYPDCAPNCAELLDRCAKPLSITSNAVWPQYLDGPFWNFGLGGERRLFFRLVRTRHPLAAGIHDVLNCAMACPSEEPTSFDRAGESAGHDLRVSLGSSISSTWSCGWNRSKSLLNLSLSSLIVLPLRP